MRGLSLVRLFAIAMACLWYPAVALAADKAEAASGPPLDIALFVNSSETVCYSSGHVLAAEKLANLAADQINRVGGVRGRPLRLTVHDNRNSETVAIANARRALATESLIAMIGFDHQGHGQRVFDAIAATPLPGASANTGAGGGAPTGASIPIITNVEKTWAAAHHRNVFSTRPNQEAERVPALIEYLAATGNRRIAFIGRTNAAWAARIGRLLREQLTARNSASGANAAIEVTADHRIDEIDGRLSAVQLAAAVQAIRQDRPDMLVLSVGTQFARDILRLLQANGIEDLPVFMFGWLHEGIHDTRTPYTAPIYGFDWAQVPEVENDRLFNVLGEGAPEDWRFADRAVADAATWTANNCNEDFKYYVPSTYSTRNIAAARFGAFYADMVKLVATSAAKTGETLDIGLAREGLTTPIERYRRAILDDLGHTYTAGRGAFRGIFENWYFRPGERVRSLTPMIVILPHTIGRKQLAPTQIIRQPNGKLKPISTLYADIDLIRLYNVDNNRKSFFADFYVALRHAEDPAHPGSALSLEHVTFANAFLDPRSNRDGFTNGREVSVDVLYGGGPSDAYPADMRMYKVSGRFRFTPDFSEYPFDKQQFSIDLQPRESDKTFIIQPPPLTLRDRNVASEGWIPKKQYVSYVEDFVPVVNAFTHRQSVVPFYNTRYVWQMERETTDYYIRVIVPLLFILIVAYLSIFIPRANLESIVTIQITALLAAVALYLSLPEIDTDSATISDRIFMFDYMMVSMMIVISILRINARVVQYPWMDQALHVIHIVIVPLVLAGLVLYISKAEILRGFTEHPAWRLIGLG